MSSRHGVNQLLSYLSSILSERLGQHRDRVDHGLRKGFTDSPHEFHHTALDPLILVVYSSKELRDDICPYFDVYFIKSSQNDVVHFANASMLEPQIQQSQSILKCLCNVLASQRDALNQSDNGEFYIKQVLVLIRVKVLSISSIDINH
jgi:hypothetical protein